MISLDQAKTDYIWRRSSFVAMHSIGGYDIVEFWNHPADNVTDKTRVLWFGTYIDGKKTGECYASLDEALAGCIAKRHEGLNNRADRYFIRMIGAEASEVREGAAA